MSIKAIETRYKGHLFRSRLEARWAVFFDNLGVRYTYEPEGFQIDWMNEEGRTARYLPDFHLTDLGTWVEVKGSLEFVTDDYLEMIACAMDWGGQLPGVADSLGTTRGLLWLGPIPRLTRMTAMEGYLPEHAIVQHSKGGWVSYCQFTGAAGLRITYTQQGSYFDSTWGYNSCAPILRQVLGSIVYDRPDHDHADEYQPALVRRAYEAASSARFEFGRRGN
jgi:hypothetical protein